MHDYHEAMKKLGRDDVTATFGVAPPAEVVGPLKPSSVYYGQAFGYDEDANTVLPQYTIPTITFEFNKYRSDLPPWHTLKEFVLASEHAGTVAEYTFIEAHHRSTDVTGDLKTVTVSGEGPITGVEGAVIDRDVIAEGH